ncbi:MAG TPA: cation diffusion facilitator family transporter [Alphaproteobacteria bacterium]|nr:cation diffusion facilitator family transporter [Alphaproteobacteria bacterium]
MIMSSAHVDPQVGHMQAEKRSVALGSLLSAAVITVLKLFVGLSTNSLGILSEAAHSGLDLLAAFITLLSVRVSDRPADADHQYGHGKVENFSAFIETGLLLLTCVWIIWEAVRRMTGSHSVHIEPSLAAFGVLAASMGVDWWRSHKLKKIAIKYDSQALEADALHFSTDILSTAVVVLGLGLVWAGRNWNLPWLRFADSIAALVVSGVIVHVSWRLARQTIDALLDAAPPGYRSRVIEAALKVDGVLEVERARMRRAGNRYFADLTVALARSVTFQRSGQVVADITGAVHAILPDCDVVIHTVPRETNQENIFDRIRAVASRNNLSVHDVSVQDLGGRLHVEQHLELNESLTLKSAHDVVTQIEAQIRREVPEISTILTHIESEPATIEPGLKIRRDAVLEQKLKPIVKEFPEILDMHAVEIKHVRGKVYMSCHCTMSDDLPLARAHEVCTALEIRFKQAAPELFKVLIHPEPLTDNER